MSDEAKRYNGKSNYETWAVHLWLTNEEESYRYWREEARRHRREAQSSAGLKSGLWTVHDEAAYNLANQLKSEHVEASPLEEASVYSDLLGAALSEVNWMEVARAILENVEPDEDKADEDNEEA